MKLADHPPAFCSVCFQADSEKRYIDFEVSWDGPVIEGESHKVSIDDLIVCEGCLESAFAVLDPEGLALEVQRLLSLLERAEGSMEEKDRMIQRLGHTTEALVSTPVKPRRGATQFVGVSDEIRMELAKAKAKTKPKPKKKTSAKDGK